MGENTKIEWATHTLNPWVGCQKVGPGCDHCYAESMMDTRLHAVQWGPHGVRKRTSEANWRKPLAWDRKAAAAGERHRVFCASLADWADTHKSILPAWRQDLGELIEATPNLEWLLLTKRIGNAREVLGEMFNHYGVPKNVSIGITVVNQAEADRDIPKLIDLRQKCEISTIFLSMEPLLGLVNLSPWLIALDWVIAGGESGHEARPMHPDWARSLRDQCELAGVPFFFKQWGEWGDCTRYTHDMPSTKEDRIFTASGRTLGAGNGRDGMVEENWRDKGGAWMARIGKAKSGRLLDGVEHNGMPASPKLEGRAA